MFSTEAADVIAARAWAKRWRHAAKMAKGREGVKDLLLSTGLKSTAELRMALAALLAHPTIADAVRRTPPPFTSDEVKRASLWGRLQAVRAAVVTLAQVEELARTTR